MEEEIHEEYYKDMPGPEQFNQELLKWKACQKNSTEIYSLEKSIELCDPDYFPNVSSVLKLLICLPVGSCSCEGSFSELCRLKTWSRCKMEEVRLNHSALMYIHSANILLDKMKILKMWDRTGYRRINLAFEKKQHNRIGNCI